MADVKRFLEESSIASRVSLPTTVVLHRLALNPSDIGRFIEEGEPVPGGGAACDLEIGGQCVAHGRMVRRRGALWFVVSEMAPLGGNDATPEPAWIDPKDLPEIPEGGRVE